MAYQVVLIYGRAACRASLLHRGRSFACRQLKRFDFERRLEGAPRPRWRWRRFRLEPLCTAFADLPLVVNAPPVQPAHVIATLMARKVTVNGVTKLRRSRRG